MIQITYQNKTFPLPVGTRVIDLLSKEDKTKYIVCQIGSQIKELNYKLTEKNDGMELIMLGLEHIEAGKAYEASLRYVIAMAFHRLYPDVKIRFSYNASRSIFCQPITPGFNMFKASESIRQEVEKIIAANLPIERITCSVAEAKKIYEHFGYPDKIDILKSKSI